MRHQVSWPSPSRTRQPTVTRLTVLKSAHSAAGHQHSCGGHPTASHGPSVDRTQTPSLPRRGGASPGVSDSDSFQSHLSQSCAGFCTGRQRLSPKERSRVGMLCVCQERDVLQMRKPRTEGVWGPHRFKISSDSLFARKSRSHRAWRF